MLPVSALKPAAYNPRKKLKKGADDSLLERVELVRNPDILAELANAAQARQVIVGFAAETDDVEANGRKKLTEKKADIDEEIADIDGEMKKILIQIRH